MNAKEQYIRQVKKALTVPRAKKDEILRDLQEAFDSALEHGETEQDVIERLGSPAEFAGDIEDQRGIKRKRHGKTALIWVTCPALHRPVRRICGLPHDAYPRKTRSVRPTR